MIVPSIAALSATSANTCYAAANSARRRREDSSRRRQSSSSDNTGMSTRAALLHSKDK